MIVSFKFWWGTKIRPRFAPHYWCTFWDWQAKKYKTGWYILDRKGKMIPWVHFDNHFLICYYENMITPIEPPIQSVDSKG